MTKKKQNLNRVYKGIQKVEGGTLSIQMEQYEGLKYIKKLLEYFQENEGQQVFSKLCESFQMQQEEYIPDIVFVQTRILNLKKNAQTVEKREFELGIFGNFLKDNYISEDPKALLLSAFLVYSILPYIMYDCYQYLNREFASSNFTGNTVSKLNKAKKEAFLELLGVHSKASTHIYDTIPLFALRTKQIGRKTIEILREDRPSIKDKAGVIALHYIFSEVFISIKKLYGKQSIKIPYIRLEDLYFYLVRPDVLIEDYNINTFLDDLYPFSGIFNFLREKESSYEENFENDDVNWFLLVFEDFQVKYADYIKVDPILDSELVDKLKIPELKYNISKVGEV